MFELCGYGIMAILDMRCHAVDCRRLRRCRRCEPDTCLHRLRRQMGLRLLWEEITGEAQVKRAFAVTQEQMRQEEKNRQLLSEVLPRKCLLLVPLCSAFLGMMVGAYQEDCRAAGALSGAREAGHRELPILDVPLGTPLMIPDPPCRPEPKSKPAKSSDKQRRPAPRSRRRRSDARRSRPMRRRQRGRGLRRRQKRHGLRRSRTLCRPSLVESNAKRPRAFPVASVQPLTL